MKSMTPISRDADKYTLVVSEIRWRIDTGEFSPGSQLPQRVELEGVFQVSKLTLQRVMNIVVDHGFIEDALCCENTALALRCLLSPKSLSTIH